MTNSPSAALPYVTKSNSCPSADVAQLDVALEAYPALDRKPPT